PVLVCRCTLYQPLRPVRRVLELINAAPVLRDMKPARRQFTSGALVEVVPAGVRGGDFVLNVLGAREGGADRVRRLLIKGWIRDPFGQHALLLLERIDPRRQRPQLALFPIGEFLALGRSAQVSRAISRSI